MRFGRSLRVLLLAVVLGPTLVLSPSAVPPATFAVGDLPDCRLDAILTEPRGYDDWEITLVDWILTLGPKYRPDDLVSVSRADVAGGGMVREVVIDDLRAMAEAARDNGTPIKVLSPFRGYKQQVDLFYSYAGRDLSNFEDAITYSARPGHSEHQTGLTIDFGSIGDTGLTSNWEETPAGGWMARNAWKYGWLMSYPDGKKDQVCYRYEPWHYRYVGRDMAEKIRESGLTIREYLWTNHTQVDPACVALPPPKLKTPGTPRSCAFAEASPTAGASVAPASAEPSADPGVSAAPGDSGAAASPAPTPASGPEPSPASALGQALPIGVALVIVVVAMLGYILWRNGKRRAGYR
jgi:zinc D-Ala-D-Ala carboxypeptidase